MPEAGAELIGFTQICRRFLQAEYRIQHGIIGCTKGGFYHGSIESIIALGVIREKKMVEVQAVGAGAANQAVKAIAIARGYLAPIGVDLICIPAFANIQIDGEDRTAIKLICEER